MSHALLQCSRSAAGGVLVGVGAGAVYRGHCSGGSCRQPATKPASSGAGGAGNAAAMHGPHLRLFPVPRPCPVHRLQERPHANSVKPASRPRSHPARPSAGAEARAAARLLSIPGATTGRHLPPGVGLACMYPASPRPRLLPLLLLPAASLLLGVHLSQVSAGLQDGMPFSLSGSAGSLGRPNRLKHSVYPVPLKLPQGVVPADRIKND